MSVLMCAKGLGYEANEGKHGKLLKQNFSRFIWGLNLLLRNVGEQTLANELKVTLEISSNPLSVATVKKKPKTTNQRINKSKLHL